MELKELTQDDLGRLHYIIDQYYYEGIKSISFLHVKKMCADLLIDEGKCSLAVNDKQLLVEGSFDDLFEIFAFIKDSHWRSNAPSKVARVIMYAHDAIVSGIADELIFVVNRLKIAVSFNRGSLEWSATITSKDKSEVVSCAESMDDIEPVVRLIVNSNTFTEAFYSNESR